MNLLMQKEMTRPGQSRISRSYEAAMRSHVRYFSPVVFCLISILLFAGCYEVHQGRYLAGKVPGWSREDRFGDMLFRYPTRKTPGWFVRIGGAKRGTLHVVVGSIAYDPYKIWTQKMLSFSGTPIRITFHDQNRETTIPPDGFQTLFGQDLDVDGSQDFTVIVPSFKIGDNIVPELSARVQWSDKKYHIEISDPIGL